MRETKSEAKTIQDAVEKGLAELGLRRDQVEVVVESEGTSGFLGFGAKKACVILREKRWAEGHSEEDRGSRGGRGGRGGRGRSSREGGRPGAPRRDSRPSSSAPRNDRPARRPGRYGYEDARFPPAQTGSEQHAEPAREPMGSRRDRVYNEEPLGADYIAMQPLQDPVEHAKTALLKMLTLMGVQATVSEARLDTAENLIFIRFESPESAMFTEENGRTLQSLQFVLNTIVNRKREPHMALRLDTGGYWESKEKELAKTVEDGINSVKNSNIPFRMEPMPAAMRKLVHNLVKSSYPGFETSSEGEGRWRKVVVRRTETAQPAAQPAAQAVAPAAEQAAAPVAEQAAVQPAAQTAEPVAEQAAAPAAETAPTENSQN